MTQAWAISIVLLLAATLLPVAQAAPEGDDAVETVTADVSNTETTATSADETATSGPAMTDQEQQKSLRDILETFVPSEEIDADKPVDFPTNI